MHSLAFKDIARQLEPLESPRFLHVTQSDSDTTKIIAELPRLKLAFIVNEDLQLESCNLCGHIVDETQSGGALFGLHNQIALRPKDSVAESLPQSRISFIPYGAVKFEAQGNHVQVTVDCGSERHLTFYQYKINTDLGYLAGSNHSLTSRLYKIYLHALTSHCLPDPLTGRAGTEEALHELSESATSSFDQIDQEQARLLQLIGSLAPQRVYNPPRLQSTQATIWANFPPLAQHYAFCTTENSILDRARSLQLFDPLGFDLEPHVTRFNEILLKRAAHRTRKYYPAGRVARLQTVLDGPANTDHLYEARDHHASGWTGRGQAASWASSVVHGRWGRPTYWPGELTQLAESWNAIGDPPAELCLTYNPDWLCLEPPSCWVSLYNLCRQASEADWCRLCICLAAAMYSDPPLPQSLVLVLVAFATNRSFLDLAPPVHSSYQLQDEYHPTSERVRRFVMGSIRDIIHTPAINIPLYDDESNYDLSQRRQSDYNKNVAALTSELAQMWVDCWPNTPTAPSGNYSSWIDVARCLQQVQVYPRNCSKNVELKTHLDEVTQALSACPTTTGLEFGSTSPALQMLETQLPTANHFLDSLCLDHILKRACPELKNVSLESKLLVRTTGGSVPATTQLQAVLAEFQTACAQSLYKKYGTELETSREDLSRAQVPAMLAQLPTLRRRYRTYMRDNVEMIQHSLEPDSTVETIASIAGIWPRLTPRILLGRLAFHVRGTTPTYWQDV
ncbi:hypothetical protein FRC10_003931 [Ceratobasidium sp. 414]|nr:hypothetical protein FRC10_003931 [Ceratobasidium sp. 414]